MQQEEVGARSGLDVADSVASDKGLMDRTFLHPSTASWARSSDRLDASISKRDEDEQEQGTDDKEHTGSVVSSDSSTMRHDDHHGRKFKRPASNWTTAHNGYLAGTNNQVAPEFGGDCIDGVGISS